ncbi:MAG: DUF1566 domain-containing protein [Elusimicrobiales bacterium]|jgi:hypothetical protein
MGLLKKYILIVFLSICAAVPESAADVSTHSFANCGFPDTGQAVCYNATVQSACPVTGFPGQDAEYASSAARLRYTMYVPVAGSSVTVDDLTGLMWVSTGSNNGGTANWTTALTSCENSVYAGYSDWRLPNLKELHSIVNYGASAAPYIDGNAFPNTVSGYWSSTVRVSFSTGALYVDFNSAGMIYHSIKTLNGLRVRCVRGGPP